MSVRVDNFDLSFLVCRLCLKLEHCYSALFDQDDASHLTMGHLANELCNLKIEPYDRYPQLICNTCKIRLLCFKNFKVECEKSDYILKHNFRKQPLICNKPLNITTNVGLGDTVRENESILATKKGNKKSLILPADNTGVVETPSNNFASFLQGNVTLVFQGEELMSLLNNGSNEPTTPISQNQLQQQFQPGNAAFNVTSCRNLNSSEKIYEPKNPISQTPSSAVQQQFPTSNTVFGSTSYRNNSVCDSGPMEQNRKGQCSKMGSSPIIEIYMEKLKPNKITSNRLSERDTMTQQEKEKGKVEEVINSNPVIGEVCTTPEYICKIQEKVGSTGLPGALKNSKLYSNLRNTFISFPDKVVSSEEEIVSRKIPILREKPLSISPSMESMSNGINIDGTVMTNSLVGEPDYYESRNSEEESDTSVEILENEDFEPKMEVNCLPYDRKTFVSHEIVNSNGNVSPYERTSITVPMDESFIEMDGSDDEFPTAETVSNNEEHLLKIVKRKKESSFRDLRESKLEVINDKEFCYEEMKTTCSQQGGLWYKEAGTIKGKSCSLIDQGNQSCQAADIVKDKSYNHTAKEMSHFRVKEESFIEMDGSDEEIPIEVEYPVIKFEKFDGEMESYSKESNPFVGTMVLDPLLKKSSDNRAELSSMRANTFTMGADQTSLLTSSTESHFKKYIPIKVYQEEKAGTDHQMSTCSTETSYKCNNCGNIFECESNLQKRMLEHSKPYQCDYCEYSSHSKHSLVTHLLKHDFFKCPICSIVLKSNLDFKKHARLHGDCRLYLCQFCGRSCRNLYNLERHMRNHNRKPLINKVLSQKNKNDKFCCEKCKMEFNKKNDLEVHVELEAHRRNDLLLL